MQDLLELLLAREQREVGRVGLLQLGLELRPVDPQLSNHPGKFCSRTTINPRRLRIRHESIKAPRKAQNGLEFLGLALSS